MAGIEEKTYVHHDDKASIHLAEIGKVQRTSDNNKHLSVSVAPGTEGSNSCCTSACKKLQQTTPCSTLLTILQPELAAALETCAIRPWSSSSIHLYGKLSESWRHVVPAALSPCGCLGMLSAGAGASALLTCSLYSLRSLLRLRQRLRWFAHDRHQRHGKCFVFSLFALSTSSPPQAVLAGTFRPHWHDRYHGLGRKYHDRAQRLLHDSIHSTHHTDWTTFLT